MTRSDEHEKREVAFLALIRYAEHGKQDRPDAYHLLYGNGHFANTISHPNIRVRKWGHESTAAGAYGIVKKTYDEAVRRGIAHDFGDDAQDAIALSLMREKSALSSIWDGNLDAAFMTLNGTWPSLPGGSQQELTAEEAKSYFWNRLGEAGQ